MFVFIAALIKIINLGLTLYMWIIIGRALISWVNPNPYNRFVLFLYRATEPVLAPIRQWMPFRGLGIDISPIIVIAAIIFLQELLGRSLVELSFYFR